MKIRLYDSKGNLIPYTGVHQLEQDEEESVLEIIDSLVESMEDFEVKVLRKQGMIDIYQTKTCSRDSFPISEPEERVEGISLLINPADGTLCGMNHFNTTKERYEKGYHGGTTSANFYILPSIHSQKYFPKVFELMNQVREAFDFSSADGFAYNKNYYILLCETARRNKQYIHQQFVDIRDSNMTDQDGCFYRYIDELHQKDFIHFKIKGKEDIVYAVGEQLEYLGHFYDNAKDFLIAYRQGITYDSLRYGEDMVFRKYVNGEKDIPIYDKSKEKEENHRELRVINLDRKNGADASKREEELDEDERWLW